MNIFDQYGIKEVADVTLYSIHKKKDGSGDVYYVPALYLDTLKISSVEKTADNVWAQGGLGNARLICWDYGKQINITLEDALCTPASLGLCWGGILSSDWKDGEVQHNLGITWNKNYVDKISRIEKAFYPRNDREKSSISYLLPQTKEDLERTKSTKIIEESKVVDGTKVEGFGYVQNHSYKWNMAIETDMKSIMVIPEKFFDIKGQSYSITKKKAVGIKVPSSGNNDDFKYEIIYAINGEEYNERSVNNANIFYFSGSSNESDFIKNVKIVAETKTIFNQDESRMLYSWTGKMYNADTNELLGTVNKLDYRTLDYTQIPPVEADWKFGDYYHLGWHDTVDYIAEDGETYKFTFDKSIEPKFEYNPYANIVIVNLTDLFSSIEEISNAKYLKIRVDNNDNYFAYLGDTVDSISNIPNKFINVEQFKGIDMWIHFNSINELIYFLITKYEDNIYEIISADILNGGVIGEDYQVENDDITAEDVYANSGKLWAYVNPKTMTPYPDDYWLHQGEPYYIKSLTLAPQNKKLKSQKIIVTAGQFPGMYMLVGETYIRNRDTGIDERMQLKFPLCKVKSDQNLTLEAEGDPTVFNLDIEVARPTNGIMMELTSYEVAEKIQIGDNGMVETKDGSTEILSE